MERRIDAYLVCAGKWHDFDYARLELLKLLNEDEHIRVKVAQDYRDTAAIAASEFLVTYTCDVRPSEDEQRAIRSWVEGGGRWLALHGTNCALDAPTESSGQRFVTPRVFPLWADTLGSQFICHPPIEPYTVTVSAGAHDDPLLTGIGGFEARDELYLMEHPNVEVVPLLETRWTGTTRGFAENEWPDDEPRLVLYRRPLGRGEVVYFTLGHCRGPWDMIDPPFDGSRHPVLDRGSWEVPEFLEILRRAITWAATPT